MSRMSVYRFISVADNLPEEFVTSMLQNGVSSTKLELLSKLSETDRTEVVENVDLESTTVKELKAEIAKLKGQTADIEKLKAEHAEELKKNDETWQLQVKVQKGIAERNLGYEVQRLEKEKKQALAKDHGEMLVAMQTQRQESERVIRALKARLSLQSESEEKITALEAQIKELESRPIDVTVDDKSEELRQKLAELEREKSLAQYRAAADLLVGSFNKWIELVKKHKIEDEVRANAQSFLKQSAEDVMSALR